MPFQKDCIPWNKGIKGATNKGSFKKGHLQSNTGRTHFKKGTSPEKTPRWKGGKIKEGQGYIFIYSSNHLFCNKRKYVLEHRLIVEKYLNRYLKLEETCHHLNEIKNDNRPENLMAFVNESAHQRFHRNPNNVKSREIVFDGRNQLCM